MRLKLEKQILLDEETYFAYPAVSNSDLKWLIHQLTKTPLPSLSEHIADAGTYLHAAIIGVGRCLPQQQDEEEKILLKEISENFWKNPLIKEIFARKTQIFKEIGFSFFWQKTWCKSKIDMFSIEEEGLLVEIKSTSASSSKQFEESCRAYDYYRQVAFYAKGIERFFGKKPKQVWIIGVSKKNPNRFFPIFVNNRAILEKQRFCRYLLEKFNEEKDLLRQFKQLQYEKYAKYLEKYTEQTGSYAKVLCS